MVTTPSIVFMVYSAHKIKKKAVKDKANGTSLLSPVSVMFYVLLESLEA